MSSPRLKDKVALVTGGSRGIGAAIARRLAQEGARVAVNYHTSAGQAQALVDELRALGAEAEAFQADVSNVGQAERLVALTVERFGKLDVLVNNAGIAELRPLGKIDPDHYQRLLNTNIGSALFVTQAATRHLGAGGRVIAISSVMANFGFPGASLYSASKAALGSLVRTWSTELGPRGITVNAVAPGLTETDMTADFPPETRAAVISRTPLGRLGQPADIANIVAFLASDDACWVNGQTITADGGKVG
jgi:3-oxoacyl-[acyl-carrier protein] reductase